MLRTSKNTSIYTDFGCNRPIKAINGSDETVHREPFLLSRGCLIVIGRVSDATSPLVLKRVKCSQSDLDLMAPMRFYAF